MKINEINEDKDLINISIALDENDLNKIKNTVYLFDISNLDPIYSKNINKDSYNDYFNIDETVNRFSNIIFNRIKKYINDNTDYDFFVEPSFDEEAFESFSAEEPIEFKAVLKPEVELINYKEDLTYPGFEINKDGLEEELKEELDALVKHNVRLEPTDKPYEEGNTISADYVLEFNGQVMDEEKNKIISTDDMPAMIKTETLLGKNIEDEVEEGNEYFNVKLKINQIYNPEYPELDDDFAAEISEFDTLEELKEDLKDKIADQMKISYDVLNQEELFKEFIKKAALKDSSEELEAFKDSDNFENLIDKLSLNNYISRANINNYSSLENNFDYNLITLIVEKLLEQEEIDLSEDIEKATKAFVEEGKIEEVIPEEARNYMDALKQYNNLDNYEQLVKEVIKDTLNYQKAFDILKDYIKEEA